MKPDDLIGWYARNRKEPAESYRFDECGIGFRARALTKTPYDDPVRTIDDDELPDYCK